MKTIVNRYIHAAYHNKHWRQAGFLDLLTSMTLNDLILPKRGF